MMHGASPSTHRERDRRAAQPDLAAPGWRVVVACLAGMAGAWIAAGSAGLIAPSLRHALAWLALATSALAAWPQERQDWRERLSLAVAIAAAIGLTVPAAALYNILAVVLLLAMLARAAKGLDRTVLATTAFAVFALALYRLACDSIPTVWLAADAIGAALGRVGATVSGRPLWIGATFAGLDFLVLMAALTFGWLVATVPPRTGRAVYAIVAILLGHLLYLLVLAWSNDLAAALPAAAPLPPPGDFYTPPDWEWTSAVRSLLPWNLPALAGAIQLLVAGVMFRWARWLPASGQAVQSGSTAFDDGTVRARESSRHAPRAVRGSGTESSGRHTECACCLDVPGERLPDDGAVARAPAGGVPTWYGAALAALAVAIPLLATYCPGKADLTGRKIVANDQGQLDWVKPTHDRYGESSVGMYGMLPELVGSLGGSLTRSAEMTDADLAGADLLVVFHPLSAWPEEQFERVWDFVRGGGSLLVVAGPRVRSDETPTCVNRLLEPTGMEVRFDIAMPVTGYWQYACQALAHPTTTGLSDERCQFGLAMGPSIRARWPARPILAGRFAWSDPGSDALASGRYRYDVGERLGDLVLAAEQGVGRGKVIVLADHTSLANEALPQSYRFAGRLLAYLAGHGGTPQAAWRQVLALAACLGLLALAGWRIDALPLATAAVVLACSLASSRATSDAAWQVVPQPAEGSGAKIALIDGSHGEAYVDSRWQAEGIAGLSLTLMRNGYLPLIVTEFNRRQLDRAALLISVGPSRAFSTTEQTWVREFVDRGGIFICTAGADRARAVNPLLAGFGFRIPASPVPAREDAPEPIPLSSVRGPYVPSGQSKAQVSFHAAWPIECPNENMLFMLQGPENKTIAAARGVGRGKVAVIADTEFALNKNLETPEGAQIAWPAKNVNFWRWFLTFLTDQPAWNPPDPKPEEKPAEENTSPDESAADGSPMQGSEEGGQ